MPDLDVALRLRASDRTGPGIRSANRRLDTFADRVRRIRNLVGVGLALEFSRRGIRNLIQTNARLQTLQVSLKTVTGSALAGAQAFQLLDRFAGRTPFTLEELTQAFVKLRGFGLDASIRSLRAYGNTALALGRTLDQFVEAVADAVTGEFERLKEFGIRAESQGNRVRFTFRGVTTSVGKNAAEIERYLRRIGETQFGGAIEDQLNTIAGAISNLVDTTTRFARAVGEGGLNAGVQELVKSLSEAGAESTSLARILGSGLGASFRTAAAVVRLLTAAAGELRDITIILAAVTGGRLVLALARAAAGWGAAGAALRAYLILAGLASRSFALLGGPQGLIIAAAAGLFLYSRRADQAAAASERLRDIKARVAEVDAQLAASSGKRAAVLRRERADLIRQAEAEVEAARIRLETRIAEATALGEPGFIGVRPEELGFISKMIQGLERLKQQVRELTAAEEERDAAAAAAADVPGGGDTLAAKIRERADALVYELEISNRTEAQQAALLALRRAGSQALIQQTEAYGAFLERLSDEELRLATAAEAHVVLRQAVKETADEKRRAAREEEENNRRIAGALQDLARQEEALLPLYDRQIAAAARWRDESLAAIADVEEDYDSLAARIEDVYARMVAAARKHRDEGKTAAEELKDAIEGSFNRAGDALADFVTGGKVEFKDLVNSILRDLARLAIQRAIVQPLFGAFSSAFGGLFGGRFHQGGVVPGRPGQEVPIVAQGGEAVLTPAQFRALSQGRGPANVEVTFVNRGTAQQEVSRRITTDPRRTLIEIVVDDLVQGGDTSRAIGSTFGLQRQPV